MFNVPNNTKVRDYRRTPQQKTMRTRNAHELRYYLQKVKVKVFLFKLQHYNDFFDERSHFVDFFFFYFLGNILVDLGK